MAKQILKKYGGGFAPKMHLVCYPKKKKQFIFYASTFSTLLEGYSLTFM